MFPLYVEHMNISSTGTDMSQIYRDQITKGINWVATTTSVCISILHFHLVSAYVCHERE